MEMNNRKKVCARNIDKQCSGLFRVKFWKGHKSALRDESSLFDRGERQKQKRETERERERERERETERERERDK